MRTVCGLDVHKDTIYLCILCETGEIFEHVYGVLTHQLRNMRREMQRRGVTEVTMESTATYWIPIWRVLEPHFRLKLVNPYFIKQLPGRKSDVKDAQWNPLSTMATPPATPASSRHSRKALTSLMLPGSSRK